MRAFVEILARIPGHRFLPLMPAAGARQYGFEDRAAHGFAMSFDGNPASVVA